MKGLLFSHISDFQRLLRRVNRTFAALYKLRGKTLPTDKNLALIAVLRQIQANAFPHEIKALSSGKQIAASSPILQLSPFIDEVGILRVGGGSNTPACPPTPSIRRFFQKNRIWLQSSFATPMIVFTTPAQAQLLSKHASQFGLLVCAALRAN